MSAVAIRIGVVELACDKLALGEEVEKEDT